MMDLMEEARSNGLPMRLGAPVVRCKAFEENLGALELARLPKMRPRTRHINVKYHHFREAVAKGRIKVQHVISQEQLGDALTKNLPRDLFMTLRKKYMGW
jgi:Holliday junction resolvase RusA-like endonuclease